MGTYTAVRGVLDPPDPAPSMLNMCPPLVCFSITRIASLVQIIDPTRFVETICEEEKNKNKNMNQFKLNPKNLMKSTRHCLLTQSTNSPAHYKNYTFKIKKEG